VASSYRAMSSVSQIWVLGTIALKLVGKFISYESETSKVNS